MMGTRRCPPKKDMRKGVKRVELGNWNGHRWPAERSACLFFRQVVRIIKDVVEKADYRFS
jgi:hypothetical protein